MSRSDRGGRGPAGRQCPHPPAPRAHPPSAFGISPPRGGENGSRTHRSEKNFSPLRGEMSRSDRGGRGRAGRQYAHPPAPQAHPPSAFGISPQGGQKMGNPTPHSENFLPPAGGDVAQRQRGARARRMAVPAPSGAAGAPPLCLRHLTPKGGRKWETQHCTARKFLPPAGGDVAQRQRGGARSALTPPDAPSSAPPARTDPPSPPHPAPRGTDPSTPRSDARSRHPGRSPHTPRAARRMRPPAR